MGRFIDLTGRKFGRLTVIERSTEKTDRVYWKCVCDCGSTLVVEGGAIRSGNTKSCGCMRVEMMSTHGESRTRLYQCWADMKIRCTPGHSISEHYYDRGIRMCEEWSDYRVFAQWAKINRYDDTLTIDRIDNDDGYYPANCRWITQKAQNRNTRNTVLVEFEGKTLPLVDWCKELNLDYKRVQSRIKTEKWSSDRALRTPTSRPFKPAPY